MSDLQDNTLPNTQTATTDGADVASAQSVINEVTATTADTTKSAENDIAISEPKTDQAMPTMEPMQNGPGINPTSESSMPNSETTITPAMGDDTPLAFASKPDMTATTTNVGSSYLPPNPTPTPSTATVASEPVKKKVKSKMMMLVLGLISLMGILGGVGYYAYYLYGTVNPVLIAGVAENDKDSCDGCYKGGWLRWDNATQTCKHTGICGSDVPGKDTEPPDNPAPPPSEKPAPGDGNCGTGYAYCGGAIDKCVSHAALAAAGGGCNKYGEEVYGIPTTYGANPGRGACTPEQLSSGATQCEPEECGGTQTYCFDRPGSCTSNKIVRNDGSVVDMGLCGLVGSTNGTTGKFQEYPSLFCTQQDVNNQVDGCAVAGDLKYSYSCGINGCETDDSQCKVVRYSCSGTANNESCVDTSTNYIAGSMTSGNSINFTNQCGTVQQIDVMCGPTGYKMSRTRINPPCETGENPPPSAPPGTPTMACTGLTRSPNTASPAIGETLTFTCAGTVTPSTAGTLSYKFRYKIGSGALTPLTNKTTTTAELTLAACGTYTVECQACTTLNGVLTCDPQWIGATQ